MSHGPDSSAAGKPGASRRHALVALVLLTLVSFFNYLDRMLLPALAQPIKEEFGLSDTQLGLLIGFAFVLVYAFVGIPIARLADRSAWRRS